MAKPVGNGLGGGGIPVATHVHVHVHGLNTLLENKGVWMADMADDIDTYEVWLARPEDV